MRIDLHAEYLPLIPMTTGKDRSTTRERATTQAVKVRDRGAMKLPKPLREQYGLGTGDAPDDSEITTEIEQLRVEAQAARVFIAQAAQAGKPANAIPQQESAGVLHEHIREGSPPEENPSEGIGL